MLMWMRYLFALISACYLFSNTVAAEPLCHCPKEPSLTPVHGDRSLPQFEPHIRQRAEFTSFRGLRLGMSKPEAREVVESLGFVLHPLASSTAMDICMGGIGIGTLRF